MPRTGGKQTIAQAFSKLDFHDDKLKSVTVRLADRRSGSATIDFQFLDDSTGSPKLLSFRRCTNIRFLMDFDVIESNRFAPTQGTSAITDAELMKKFVRAQIPHWHVKYMAPSPQDKPIRKKLETIRKHVLFRVTFFGGTVEILARSFVLPRVAE
jgi:hypothetical protein